MRTRLLFVALGLLVSTGARAQGPHHEEQPPPEVGRPAAPEMHRMQMTGPLDIPAAREGSGTAWLPDETEMRGHHASAGGFDLMLHYNLFSGFDYQGSDVGKGAPISTNWVMGMAEREVLGGQLTARAMLSLEPLTVGKGGYPLLLQTGQTYQGKPLIDRQRPHDLFMETALMYTRPIADTVAIQVHGG
jgi:hypothetical protein